MTAMKLEEQDLNVTVDTPPLTPSSSPRKRSSKANPSDGSPRKKQVSPSKKAPAPSCLAEAPPEYQMMFNYKDEGKSWTEISKAWTFMTGEQVNDNTVRKRYDRMKANFTVFAEEDVSFPSLIFAPSFTPNLIILSTTEEQIPRLLEACKSVEAEIERIKAEADRDKFSRIAKAIVGAGGGSYTAVVVQKKLKELSH